MNKGFLKRFTAMMLCLVMVVGMLPMTAGAATEVIAPVSGESYYIGDTTNFIAADGTVTNYENAVAWTATESGEGYILSYGGSYLCAAMDTALNKYVPKVLGDVSAEDVSAGNVINVWLWDADNNSFYYPSGYNQTPNYICLVDGSLAFTEDSTAAVFRAYTDNTQSVTYSEDSSSTASSTSTDEFYRIVHLDCGRKYFSVDSIKALIDNAAAAGYTHLQLAFGNDGLRFLLNDMSISYGTVTLTDTDTINTNDAMTGHFAAGNASQNASGDSSYLTEADMAAIFEYAEGKIKIIPLLNMPGHMTAIVYAMEELGVSNFGYGSSGSLNITDDTAVGLAKALLQKYINYFKGLGCTLFNIGADEFANDIYSTGSMGFGHLVSTKASDGTTYYAKYFVPFLNDMADIITTAGMTPMAFNDGFYYGGADVSINTSYMVCYWSSGYNDYAPASAATVANKGHKMINTHGDYYYVLKDGDNGQVVNSNASSFSVTDFMGDDPSASQIAGAMFCIWCDYPNYPSTAGATDATWSDTAVITNSASYLADTGAAIAKYSSTGTDGGTTDGGTTGGESGGEVTPVIKNVILYLGDDTLNSYSDTINDYCYTTYTDSNPGFVTVGVEGKEGSENSSGGVSLGNVATTLSSSDSYIIASGTNYMGIENGALIVTTDISKAAVWTYSTTSEVFSCDSLYLSGGYMGLNVTADYNSALAFASADGYLSSGGMYPYCDGTAWKIAGGTPSDTTAKIFNAASGGSTTPASTTVTFEAVAVGYTEITVGHVTYNVTVYPAPTSTLPVELWITNGTVKADGALSDADSRDYTYYYVNIPDTGVNTESGVDINAFIPENGTKVEGGQEVDFWKVVYLPEGVEQSTDAKSDHSLTADTVTKVRYWDGKWQVYVYDADTDASAWVDYNSSTDQIVAYYLMHTSLISEDLAIVAHTKDWGSESGKASSNPEGYCTVSIQIVFPDGTTNPVDNNTTLIPYSWVFNYWTDRDLGYYQFDINEGSKYEIYRITDTLGNPDLSGNVINGFTWDTVEVNGATIFDETILRDVPQGENLGESVAIYSDESNGGINWSDEKKAHLIRVYVRPVTEAAEVTVHYIDNMTGLEVYSYGINSHSGVTFSDGEIITSTSSTGKYVYSTSVERNVLGSDGEYLTANVTSDLTKMPEIAAQYRYCDPTCTKYEISDDGKSLTFYYDFKPQRIYVMDFGLSVAIEHSKYYTDEIEEASQFSISKVEIYSSGTTRYGTLAADNSGNVTYTLNTILNGIDAYTVIVYYTVDSEDVAIAYHFYFMPASNVLYEEDFFVSVGSGWSGGGSAVGPQTTPSSSDIYGYDSAYANSVGLSGEKAYTAAVSSKNRTSGALVTDEFYGNAFDLIADCGPTTGMVILLLQDTTAATGAGNSKMAIIDTRFYGNGGNTTLNQVPIAHIMLEEGSYKAYVYANYLSGDAATQTASTLGVMGGGIDLSDLWDVYDWMDSMGIMPEDAEYIYFDDSSPLAGIDRAINAPVAMFALDDGLMTADNDGNQNVVLRQEGTSVSIDGFRVYRSTDNENYNKTKYSPSEYNVDYMNVLASSVYDDAGSELFYVEDLTQTSGDNNLVLTSYTNAAGYPKNELYLQPGASIVLNVGTSVKYIQVSARSVISGAKLASGSETSNALPNTEMYYVLEVDSTTGLVNITNPTGATGLLAIAFFKLPAAAASAAFLEVDEALAPAAFSLIRRSMEATEPLIPEEDVSGEENNTPAEPEEPVLPDEPEAPEVPESPDASDEPITPILPSISGDYSMFNPDSMKMQVSESIVDGVKYVTLTIYASTDVEKLTINGTPVWASNYNWVRQGLQNEYRFTKLLVVDIDETAEFNVVAYDKNGKASHPYIIFE